MNEWEIRILAALMFEEYGVDRHWRFKLEDALPSTGGGQLGGHTSWDQRIVRMSRRYAFDWTPDRVRACLEHEIAHIFTPQDWVHGEDFHAKLTGMRATR